jgi:hypothetical protein
MPTDSDFTIRVRLTAAYPELCADLAALSPKLRGERMKVLATVGLALWRGGQTLLAGANTPTTSEPGAVATDPQIARKARLLSRLGS